jgi:hypothetical protein
VEEQQLERGQEVWIDGRRAVLLDVNAVGAPIVRFEGERGTRVVPMRKLRLRPGDSPSDRAAGSGAAA